MTAKSKPGDGVLAKGDPKLASKFPVFTDPGQLPSLHAETRDGNAFPLEHTDVRAIVSAEAADVEITQTFASPKGHPIEAVYVFPLPDNAAVHDMRLTIGERVIEASIQERTAAKKTYDQAKKQGFTAALLEQERSNLFTQSVANIEPGKKVQVTLRYTQDLTYDAGVVELVFPMAVGPRYLPGTAKPRTPKGTGTKPDTDRVPDASRISPAYENGLRPGHDISLEVVTAVGFAIGPFEVPNQKVKAHREANGTLDIVLADDDQKADRDFVMRYRVAGAEPRSTLAYDEAEGFFSLSVVPPDVDLDDLVGQRELVFVVDVSGSMSGQPLARCKEAMRDALSRLRPVDTFNIITFSGRTGKAFVEPRKATTAAIREGLDFVSGLRAGGGTEMLDAIAAALTPDVASGRHRYVFFMTDGFVGEEDQIMKATKTFVAGIEAKGKRAKVFGFGVGSSPNRALIEGLSREGKGVAVYASNREDPGRAVNQFYRYIDRSVLRDVKVDFGSNAVSETMPAELPDLFASRPLVIHGRMAQKPTGTVTVHATSAKGPVDIPVTFVAMPASPDAAAPSSRFASAREVKTSLLGTLWARSKVTWLESDLVSGNEAAKTDITRLGLEFGLVTRFTSFVAVDRSRRVEGAGGKSETLTQPLRLPEGVDGNAAGGWRFSTEYWRDESAPDAPDASPGRRPSPAEANDKPDQDHDGVLDRRDRDAPPAEPAAVERGPRGCNCELAREGDASHEAALFALGVGIVAATVRRRQTRATRCRW